MKFIEDDDGNHDLDFSEEVETGVTFLNMYAPHWYMDIDWTKLNMDSTINDILGQLTKSRLIPEDAYQRLSEMSGFNYYSHIQVLADLGYTGGDSGVWARRMGFDAYDPEALRLALKERVSEYARLANGLDSNTGVFRQLTRAWKAYARDAGWFDD